MRFAPAVLPPADLSGQCLWLVFRGATVLVGDEAAQDGSCPFPSLNEVGGLGMEEAARQYLGKVEGQGVFAVAVTDAVVAPTGYHFEDLRRLP